ncbi:MAG TPA: acyltransferase [Urbifossiella sp.]|nr:acyltransferase [Urbifossiella sp.]
MTQHFHNVQALRGVACLMVVLGHLRSWDVAFVGGTPGFGVIKYFGFAGVDLFFVLSGFIITATNRKSIGRPAALPGYLFRRAWRIYPTYWAAMVLIVAAAWATIGAEALLSEAAGRWPEWTALAPLDDTNPVIGPAWTLTYELMFYAAFGLLLCLPPRAAAAGLAAWAVVVTAALFTPVPTNRWAVLPLSPFVFEFLGGCLVAWLTGRSVRGRPGAALAAGLAWATVGIVVVAAGPIDYGVAIGAVRLRVLVFGPAAVLIVYAAVAAEGRWRVPRWLLRTGDASYSLYLTHGAVMLAAIYLGTKVPHTRVPHLTGLVVTLGVALAVGFVFYALVEKPLLNLGRRRPKPAPAVAVPAVPLSRAA